MQVIEIFESIDGEGLFAGCMATFIRLGGCNLRCRYCDTAYAQGFHGAEHSIDEIIGYVDKARNQHVTLTGGEPLIHAGSYEFVTRLTNAGYIVNIETNGSIDISDFQMMNSIITMDYKLECSGEIRKMNMQNLRRLRCCDVLKFVTDGSKEEEDCIFGILKDYHPKAHVYLSPVFGKCKPKTLVNMFRNLHMRASSDVDLEQIMNRSRVQLQLHKLLECK